MKITYCVLLLLLLLSCSHSNKEKVNHNAIDIETENSNDLFEPVDSTTLNELTAKTPLFAEILDTTFELADKQQFDFVFHDYDCFIIVLERRIEFDDTLCYVAPWKMKHLLFVDDTQSGFYGYWKWKKYPVFINGDVATSFFQKKESKKIFCSGTPILDGDIPWPRFRIINNSFVRVNEFYP